MKRSMTVGLSIRMCSSERPVFPSRLSGLLLSSYPMSMYYTWSFKWIKYRGSTGSRHQSPEHPFPKDRFISQLLDKRWAIVSLALELSPELPVELSLQNQAAADGYYFSTLDSGTSSPSKSPLQSKELKTKSWVCVASCKNVLTV